MVKYSKIKKCLLYSKYLLYIAALKIGAVAELIWSILKFWRYLRNISRKLPGEVEQSLSPPCVCVRNHGARAAALLPRPLHIARLCVFHELCYLIEERRMDLYCLCVARRSLRRPCSQLSCNSMEYYSTRFHNLQGYGVVWGCRLHSHRYCGA